MTFSGFKSRCTTPCAWAKATASRMRSNTLSRFASGSEPRIRLVEPAAGHQLHHVERPPIEQGSSVMDRNNAGMIEPREDVRFAPQSRRP